MSHKLCLLGVHSFWLLLFVGNPVSFFSLSLSYQCRDHYTNSSQQADPKVCTRGKSRLSVMDQNEPGIQKLQMKLCDALEIRIVGNCPSSTNTINTNDSMIAILDL